MNERDEYHVPPTLTCARDNECTEVHIQRMQKVETYHQETLI